MGIHDAVILNWFAKCGSVSTGSDE